ncbi:MAG: hypothetical protein AAF599_16145, partial [Bacteroidota bacterium]
MQAQEVGTNDFQISFTGPDGDTEYEAKNAAMAYNEADNEYLVVWYGGQNSISEGEEEIWGQRMDADGNFLGAQPMRISDIGKDNSKNYDARSPNVAFNSMNDEYLVVWSGNEDGYDKTDFRTWGQRIDGATGAELGENDFLISAYGPDRVLPSENHVVDVAYDNQNNRYLVVWSADDFDGAASDGEFEIWGKRLEGADATGIESEEFRISDVGTDGDEERDGARPYIVFNSENQEYLVAWEADEANEEFEIYGQRLAFEAVQPTCEDGIQNGDETGIDCGGVDCPDCPEPTCDDGIQNGDETGIDCGGSDCTACPTCEDGIQNGDETGIDCGGDCEPCQAEPTCDDGIQNGDETGIDCGGSDCSACPTCDDGIQNGNETGIDCGGDCEPCQAEPTCDDGIQNGDETGVDCGGSDCPACPTCDDGIQNGNETGIDCGGDCEPCQAEPTCDDGIQNGDEIGVDCGGSDCPACPTCEDGIQNGNETGIDCGGDCEPCQAEPDCAIPSNLEATNIQARQATLTWDAVD